MSFLENLQLPECLKIPTPFLLQEYPKEKLTELQDENGFGFVHWAIAQTQLDKLEELLDCDFHLNLKSSSNLLPENLFYDLEEIHNVRFNRSIPFTKGGLTPIHVSVVLHQKFEKSVANKKGIELKTLAQKQRAILCRLAEEYDIFSVEDTSGLTVTHYCFLLEDFTLLELILRHDPEFNSLNRVKINTAIRIIELYQKNKDTQFIDTLGQALALLKKKENYLSLSASLPEKKEVKSQYTKI